MTFSQMAEERKLCRKELIETLISTWEKKPELRLGQLLMIALSLDGDMRDDIFYIEDNEILEALQNLLKPRCQLCGRIMGKRLINQHVAPEYRDYCSNCEGN